MKIEKYIFSFPKANKLAAGKVGAQALSPTQLQVIYCIRRIGTATNSTIIQYLRRMQNTANENAVSYALRDLTANGMLEKTGRMYVISPSGREYMARVRQYLVNVRM
jgi:DNA-binding PadR family transcriptional regulator